MRENKLFISTNHQYIGELVFDGHHDRLILNYSDEWKQNGYPLSPHLPLNQNPASVSIRRFLENLFPEGKNLEILLEQFRIGSGHTFRILQIMGSETTGAITFSSKDEKELQNSFREVSEKELIERLNERKTQGLIIWDGRPRLSVAGVQDKLPLTIFPDGRMGFGEGNLASTHILKFQKNDEKIKHIVINEYFCMKLAKALKLDVAEVNYRRFGDHPVLVVKRFDREWITEEEIKRLHLIDGCQALDLPGTHKYERNFGSGRDVAHIRDGASLKALFNFCNQCLVPATAVLKTLDWLIFNLYVSNSDAHGKNISYLVDAKGITPSPLYDIVNISVYPALEQELAMGIGDEFSPLDIYAFQLAHLCEETGLKKRMLAKQIEKLGRTILDQLDKVETNDLPLSEDEKSFLVDLKENIRSRTMHFAKCSKDIPRL